MKRGSYSLCLLAVALSGCPTPPSEPPPPLRKAEIPSAPPSALGALAGGTDAAPRPEAAVPSEPEAGPLPLPLPEPPAAEVSPEAPPPALPAAPTALPDGGMAL